MKSYTKWTVPVCSGVITCLVFGLVAALAVAQKPAPKKNYKVHVVQWGKDAKLSRKLSDEEIKKIKSARKKDDKRPIPAYKTVSGVKGGTTLEVPDILETKKLDVAIQGGALAYTRLKPNTRLKYLSIKPTELRPTIPADLYAVVEKGKAQFRVGSLAQPSLIKILGPLVATGAKGTAYSVNVQGQKTTLIVAEGEVEIYMETAPGAAITVKPREKVVYTAGDPFPEQAVDIAPAEENEIRELLSLPVQNLYGYVWGQDIRRPDAERIVVTNVEYINRAVDGSSLSTYKPSWGRPDRVLFSAIDNFWTTDSAGARTNVGKGFYFEGLSPDGRVIYASKPRLGLWRMDWNGGNKVQVTGRPVGGVTSISPDGKRVLAAEGWIQAPIFKWDSKKRKEVNTGRKKWVTTNSFWVAVDSVTRSVVSLNKNPDKFRRVTGYWRNGGTRLIAQLGNSGRNRFLDVGKASSKLVHEAKGFGNWLVSPAGKWIFGPNSGSTQFVRVADGIVFTHPGGENGMVLLGENNALIGAKVIEIENPGDPGRDRTNADQLYPVGATSFLWPDVSPNGEIIAYRTDENPYLASFADSLDLSRFTTTAVATSLRTQRVSWLSGNRVLYETPEWDRTRNQILTLGVKRPGKASEGPVEASNPAATKPPLAVLDLLGKTSQEVTASLGKPDDQNEFDSYFVLHLHYRIPIVGKAKFMFTHDQPGSKKTWLHQIEISSNEDRSERVWANLVGIDLDKGWTRPNAGTREMLTRFGFGGLATGVRDGYVRVSAREIIHFQITDGVDPSRPKVIIVIYVPQAG